MRDARDEFYVGYLERCPPGIAARVRLGAGLALALGVAVALLLVTGQSRFDEGVFEFGVEKTFDGLLVERPYPMLIVPDGVGDDAAFVTHPLSAFGKRGADELVAGLGGQAVRVTGSLIYNRSKRMIEAHAVEPLEGGVADDLRRRAKRTEQPLGRMTLVGEIVDSKCHLGVMKPGRGKPHKACAIRCISGGVPPVLRVEDRTGRVDYFLLVSEDGRSVNREVLDLIAEPVRVTGDVVRSGDLLVLYADPATYSRVES